MSRRLQSRWQGDGDHFTLIVGIDDDGLEGTDEEWLVARERYGVELQRLLAEEHGYTYVDVEVTEPYNVSTIAAAKAARAEWEMQDAVGYDLYMDISERAWEHAWSD